MNWVKRWFGTPTNTLQSYAALGADMHAHWLPGIDDGAQTLTDSLEMIHGLVELGFRKLTATPHIMCDLYQNTPTIIRERLEEVRGACEKEGLPVELNAAAEYLLDEGFTDHLRVYGPLLIAERYILIEHSFHTPPPNLSTLVFDLQTRGYRPILAHPERYRHYHGQLHVLTELAARGVALQVNLMSLTGHYGKQVKNAAEALISTGQVSFLGTDIHRPAQLPVLREVLNGRQVDTKLTLNAFVNRTL